MIPVANTTVSVIRVTQPEDAYSEHVESIVARGIRAVISEAGGALTRDTTGALISSDRKMTSDPADIRAGDKILCERTGVTYLVSWASPYAGPLTHVTASLSEMAYTP